MAAGHRSLLSSWSKGWMQSLKLRLAFCRAACVLPRDSITDDLGRGDSPGHRERR